MKILEETIVNHVHQSEVLPNVRTMNSNLGSAIEWADDHPVIWRIVTGRKSKAFGLGSSVYIGWAQRSTESDAVLERIRHMREAVENLQPYYPPDSIFVWRAKFTMKHYRDTGFTGGFFQQHDARYPRSCLTLDYTPETLQEVLDRFCAWMDQFHRTVRITVDGKTVRTFPDPKEE